jgi:acyl transferase domain-containing protein
VQALRSGECAVALAGGVNLTLTGGRFSASEKVGLLSPNGVGYAFDANADGFVRGEGAAAILLKPLARALADGDTIRAVIKGSAVHHGGRGESLLDPGTRGQIEAIRKAYAAAGIAPETVSYFETQGSGTAMGDARDLKIFEQAAEGSSAGECWLGCLAEHRASGSRRGYCISSESGSLWATACNPESRT